MKRIKMTTQFLIAHLAGQWYYKLNKEYRQVCVMGEW